MDCRLTIDRLGNWLNICNNLKSEIYNLKSPNILSTLSPNPLEHIYINNWISGQGRETPDEI